MTGRGVVYTFNDCELDTRVHEFRRGGVVRHVEPQVFDVLKYLLAHRDRLVTREELLDAVWGHRFVAPTTLNGRIRLARQAVGDDGASQRVIQTVHGRGFRVIVPVEMHHAEAPDGGARTVEQRIRFCTSRDGVRIAWATSGTGPPLVKPAHWLTHLEYDWESPVWRPWLRELSRDHTLVRYDARGSGLSDRDVETISFDAAVGDLEAVVDHLGLERFPLLGISQGCAIAVAYAARHPERVTGLVLYGGYAQGRVRRARSPQELEEARMLISTMPLGWGRDNPAFRQFFASMFLPDGTPEQHRWFSELQRITTTPETAVRMREASAMIDVSVLAARVAAPALVLHATGDTAVPFDQGRVLTALLPDARFVALESRNHVLLEDEPAWPRFLQEIRAFLGMLRGAGPPPGEGA